MREQLVAAMGNDLCQTFAGFDQVAARVRESVGLAPELAVLRLHGLVESFFVYLGRDRCHSRVRNYAGALEALHNAAVVPESVFVSGKFLGECRNLCAHPEQQAGPPRRRPALGADELVSYLSVASGMARWMVTQPEWPHFVEYWRRGEAREQAPTADTPSGDWLDLRVAEATDQDIEEIVRLDQDAFEPDDWVDYEVFVSWHRRDPGTFVCAHLSGAPLAGYYSRLFLRPPVLEALELGRVRERDLGPEDLVPPEEIPSQTCVYVFSLVVRAAYGPVTPLLLSHLGHELHRLYEEGDLRRVYALAATEAGRRLIEDRFGFRLVARAEDRPDRHPMYELELAESTWARLRFFAAA